MGLKQTCPLPSSQSDPLPVGASSSHGRRRWLLMRGLCARGVPAHELVVERVGRARAGHEQFRVNQGSCGSFRAVRLREQRRPTLATRVLHLGVDDITGLRLECRECRGVIVHRLDGKDMIPLNRCPVCHAEIHDSSGFHGQELVAYRAAQALSYWKGAPQDEPVRLILEVDPGQG